MKYSDYLIIFILLLIFHIVTTGNFSYFEGRILNEINTNHSEILKIETEKQKTIADFLRSVKTGRENKDASSNNM